MELGKRIEFENRKEGMEKFLDWANKIMKANGKESMIVGLEPTGHYWLCFEQYLRENGIKVVLVRDLSRILCFQFITQVVKLGYVIDAFSNTGNSIFPFCTA